MNTHGINFVKSEDKEFDISVQNTMITMFIESYNATSNVATAVKVIESNLILRMKGFVQAVNKLQYERKIPKAIIKEINELYPEHRI